LIDAFQVGQQHRLALRSGAHLRDESRPLKALLLRHLTDYIQRPKLNAIMYFVAQTADRLSQGGGNFGNRAIIGRLVLVSETSRTYEVVEEGRLTRLRENSYT
jgi:hypothetical protein